MATQSQDPNWEEAQALRLAEYKKQRAAGAFDKDKTLAQKQATQAEIKAKGSSLLTGNYTKGVTPTVTADRTSEWSTPTSPTMTPQQSTQGDLTAQADSSIYGQNVSDTSNIAGTVQRDFNREQAALERNGLDLNSIANLDPKQLFEMTYSEKELAGLADYQKLLDYEKAKGTMENTPKPTNTMMAGLEDALRKVSDPAKQNLGVSDFYKQAGIATDGVSGYTTLMQSLNSQNQVMNDNYKSFINQLSTTGGAMSDTYNAVAEKYKLHLDEYNRVYDTYETVLQSTLKAQQEFDFLQKQYDLEQQAVEWANANPSPETIADMHKNGYTWNESTQKFDYVGDSDNYLYDDGEISEGIEDAQSQYPEGNTQFRTTNVLGNGTVTGIDGSKYWEPGLDFVLDGGMGAEVKAPVGGEVVQVDTGHVKGEKGSFGNRVKIKMPDGREIWFSHLKDVNVKKGDKIGVGTMIGTQGNTGSTYGQTGIHLDITMKKPDGSYHTAREVAAYLDTLGKIDKTKKVISSLGKNPLTTIASGIDLYKQFQAPAKVEDDIMVLWTKTFGDEPTKAEQEKLAFYGDDYIDWVKAAKDEKSSTSKTTSTSSRLSASDLGY
jgi:murein DD-endopeptidase MepM/ murein hydrolase activator NlpD